jgi:hypothetical protein
VLSLTPPYPVTAVNSPWWLLKGISPSEPEYKERPLQEVFRELNRFPAKVVDHVLSLLPRVARGVPARVAFISSSLAGSPTLSYLRILPLANEALEMFSALVTLSEVPLPPATVR